MDLSLPRFTKLDDGVIPKTKPWPVTENSPASPASAEDGNRTRMLSPCMDLDEISTDSSVGDASPHHHASPRVTTALAVFGHASRQLINRRIDLLRSEIQPDFAHLCSNSTPVTDKLFGDNVTDNVKEIQNIKRVERVITKRWRGRQQPYPYQGAGPRFQGYRPQQQWPRGSFQPRGRFFPRGRGGPNRMRNPNWTRGQASSTVTRASHKKAE